MATVYLVRHGRAAAGYGGHPDPGLDDTGRQQAIDAANALAGAIAEPVTVVTSPLARARETAAPLVARWRCEPAVENRIAEIPSPTDDLAERSAWLRGVMAGSWSNLDQSLLAWRQEMIDWALARDADVIAFSHFVAINVLVGAATGAGEVISFAPDNGSITRLGNDGGALTLLELGRQQGGTRIN